MGIKEELKPALSKAPLESSQGKAEENRPSVYEDKEVAVSTLNKAIKCRNEYLIALGAQPIILEIKEKLSNQLPIIA